MKTSTQMVLALVVVGLGIVLMIGGIVTGQYGATVVGIVVAGVAAQRYLTLRKRSGNTDMP
jgi:hypothetical protein